MEKLYASSYLLAKKALDYECNIWDIKESPARLGHFLNIEEFIAHSATQKDTNSRMYAYHNDDSATDTNDTTSEKGESTVQEESKTEINNKGESTNQEQPNKTDSNIDSSIGTKKENGQEISNEAYTKYEIFKHTLMSFLKV